MITLDEAIENELLNKWTLKVIPKTCKYCNSNIVFTNNLKNIYCSNKDCIGKKINQFMQVVNQFGLDINEDEVIEILEADDSIKSVAAKAFKFIKDTGLDIELSIWEYVRAACIPEIPNTAYKIFYGYNNLDEAYMDIYNEGITIINTRLGLHNESNIIGANIYKLLMEHKEELEEAIEYIGITKENKQIAKIVVDSFVQGYRSSIEFIQELNNNFGEHIRYLLMGTVTKETSVLIIDGGAGSLKYKTAKKINDTSGTERIKIMGSRRYLYELGKSKVEGAG